MSSRLAGTSDEDGLSKGQQEAQLIPLVAPFQPRVHLFMRQLGRYIFVCIMTKINDVLHNIIRK